MSSESSGRGLLREAWGILTWADRLLVLAVASAALLLSLRGRGTQAGQEVWLETPGTEAQAFPLAADRVISVPGALGPTRVEIHGGAARIAASPCREERCVAQGWIRRAGEVAVCLPNRVLLRVEGGASGPGPDAVTR